MFTRKTTQSIFEAFTKDLEEVRDRENDVAAKAAAKEAKAKAERTAAVAEAIQAQQAIANIKQLFTKKA